MARCVRLNRHQNVHCPGTNDTSTSLYSSKRFSNVQENIFARHECAAVHTQITPLTGFSYVVLIVAMGLCSLSFTQENTRMLPFFPYIVEKKNSSQLQKTFTIFSTLGFACFIFFYVTKNWLVVPVNEACLFSRSFAQTVRLHFIFACFSTFFRKRQTADVSIIDSTSRGHTHNRIKLVLMRMLTELDASMGENCRCTFEQISRYILKFLFFSKTSEHREYAESHLEHQ